MDSQTLSRPNPASGTPVYLQLVEQVKRRLESGALQPGEALPGVVPLAEALVVHPAAVARAYRELEALSLAVRTDGCAPRVVAATRATGAGPRPITRMTGWAGLGRELETAREVQRCLLPPVGRDRTVSTTPACPGGARCDRRLLPLRAAARAAGGHRHRRRLRQGRAGGARDGRASRLPPRGQRAAAGRSRALVTMVNDLVYASVPVGPVCHALLRRLRHRDAHARVRQRRSPAAGAPSAPRRRQAGMSASPRAARRSA